MNDVEKINSENFISYFNGIAEAVHATAKEKGWWNRDREFPELVALMHSELSEALEAYREDKMDDKLPQFHGVTVELADCIIRIMDYVAYMRLPVARALIEKYGYNKTRPYRHGLRYFPVLRSKEFFQL